jgi:hypothetical protein
MADKEFTYSDVSEHNTKKDLFIVVHDKVYNASSFVDEHPYVAPLLQCTLLHAAGSSSYKFEGEKGNGQLLTGDSTAAVRKCSST